MAASVLAEKIVAELFMQGLIEVSDMRAARAVVDKFLTNPQENTEIDVLKS